MKEEKSSVYGSIFRFETREEEEFALSEIRKIIERFHVPLTVVMLPPNVMARGEQGDQGTYTRMVLLEGPCTDWSLLSDLSTEITNAIPVNKVLFHITNKKSS